MVDSASLNPASTGLGSADLARKRSRSTSPTGDSNKKANKDPSGPSSLEVDNNVAHSNTTTTKNGDGSATANLAVGGENGDASTGTASNMATDASNSGTEAGTNSGAVEAKDGSSSTTTPMVVDGTSGTNPDLPANPTTLAGSTDAAATAAAAAAAEAAAVASIQMRALIVTQDASIIIGKGGKNVNEIREKSGSKITITESVPGNPERIMVIGGQLDAVSKAFGLVVRRINDEPFDVPSVPGSRAVTIRFIIPNSRMGSVIGKAGSKIKEIQEASGARLQASEAMLPGSTERVLSVSGVADAIHIAVYYIGTILLEHPVPTASHTSYRPSGGAQAYPPTSDYRSGGGNRPYGGDHRSSSNSHPSSGGSLPMPGPGSASQQIYIPNDLVGSIIGKGGSKINEIRQLSQCQIKINEPGEASPGANPSERLVTITGSQSSIQIAVGLLYQRLEQEKQKQLANA